MMVFLRRSTSVLNKEEDLWAMDKKSRAFLALHLSGVSDVERIFFFKSSMFFMLCALRMFSLSGTSEMLGTLYT